MWYQSIRRKWRQCASRHSRSVAGPFFAAVAGDKSSIGAAIYLAVSRVFDSLDVEEGISIAFSQSFYIYDSHFACVAPANAAGTLHALPIAVASFGGLESVNYKAVLFVQGRPLFASYSKLADQGQAVKGKIELFVNT